MGSTQISFADISFNVELLWAFLAFFFAGYVIMGGILFFHWRAYSLGNKRVVVAETVFALVSILLFFIAISTLSLV